MANQNFFSICTDLIPVGLVETGMGFVGPCTSNRMQDLHIRWRSLSFWVPGSIFRTLKEGYCQSCPRLVFQVPLHVLHAVYLQSTFGARDWHLLRTDLTSIKQHVTPDRAVAAQPDAFFVTRPPGAQDFCCSTWDIPFHFQIRCKRPVLELS